MNEIKNFLFEDKYQKSVEPEKILSPARFERGFQAGLRFGLETNLLITPIVSAAIFMNLSPAEREIINSHIASNTPYENYILIQVCLDTLATLFLANATVYGLVDSFKPTSILFSHKLRISALRGLSMAFQTIRDLRSPKSDISTV